MLNSTNHILVPSSCLEYVIDTKQLVYPMSYPGINGDYFKISSIGVNYEAVQLINPSAAPRYLFDALKDLENQTLPNHGADDDICDCIPDFIDQILFLSVQISEEQFRETCKNLNRILQQEDPRNPGESYLEVFNEEEDIYEEDYTALNPEKYRAAIKELRSLLQ